MRSWLPCSAVVLALAACGGDEKPIPAPKATATPPPADELKTDMLTAAVQLDAYKLDSGTFTDDETELGEAFPPTVTIKGPTRTPSTSPPTTTRRSATRCAARVT